MTVPLCLGTSRPRYEIIRHFFFNCLLNKCVKVNALLLFLTEIRVKYFNLFGPPEKIRMRETISKSLKEALWCHHNLLFVVTVICLKKQSSNEQPMVLLNSGRAHWDPSRCLLKIHLKLKVGSVTYESTSNLCMRDSQYHTPTFILSGAFVETRISYLQRWCQPGCAANEARHYSEWSLAAIRRHQSFVWLTPALFVFGQKRGHSLKCMGLLGSVTFKPLAWKALREIFVKMVGAPQVVGLYLFGISSLSCKGVFVMHFM